MNKPKYPTAGQPAKINRNMLICELRDKQNKSLSELAELFNVDTSRISRIIDANWDRYVETKRSQKELK